jgi:CBS domain-containing protein
MKVNLENTTVKDIAYLINSSCLRAAGDTSLEKLADMICSSDRYKIYLEDAAGKLTGVIQAKQLAMKVLELSRQKDDAEEMLPTVTYVMNFLKGSDLAEPPVTVTGKALLKQVLELMNQNSIREIAVVDEEGVLIGTLEAKNILSHYLQSKAQASL